MVPLAPKILLIDSYDSFTHNLAHLIRRNVPSSQIYLIRNDDLNYETLLPLLPCFSAVFVGPGPGSPSNDVDVGVIKKLWSLPDSHLLPVFGVCLGFQSFVLSFGGSLRTMQVVKHGMISHIEHENRDLFESIAEDVEATRYHSLCVDLVNEHLTSEIDPLAWAEDGEENGRVLMAARHRHKPFWGVQYHPESVCTQGGGGEVIRNFWKLAVKWTITARREVHALTPEATGYLGAPWPHSQLAHASSSPIDSLSVSYVSLNLPRISVTRVCELLGVDTPHTSFVMLDSAAKSGRFTIIGALLPSTLSIRYTLHETHIVLQRGTAKAQRERIPPGTSIWDWLARFMGSRSIQDAGREDVPFWGGLVGYLSYELGVAELGVPLKHRVTGEKRNADVNLVFVERSIVIDGETGCVHVQSLIKNDESWLQNVSRQLEATTSNSVRSPKTTPSCSRLTSPSREVYVPQVSQCKHHLSVGSSYELCLTAPSTLHIPTSPCLSSWDLYTRLRASNPAPHAAFLRLGPTTLLCSSPERFLKWDRSGRCQLRPIKGTLRKTIVDERGKKHKMERKDADELLGKNVKERAENLMIVDLVRHDLGGVVEAADGVKVEQLMGIEEYETVWQMVSVISGTVQAEGGGWEVLRRSLPPGSMTGAPKKRSVELLQDIEGQERGVYSGVCGYWCVGGGGDWAVIIRSCFRYDEKDNGDRDVYLNGNGQAHPTGNTDSHLNGEATHFNGESTHLNGADSHLNGGGHEQDWTLGAGGAITALSDPVAEWEEMRVKLASVGRAFGVDEL